MKNLQRILVAGAAALVLLTGCASTGVLLPQAQQTQAQQVRQFALNGITVYEVIDSPLSFPATMFKDIEKYPDRLALMPGGAFQTVIKSFVVKTGGRIVLIDGGVGNEHYVTKGKELDVLTSIGIAPEEVTDILMTHLDVDHEAGLVDGTRAVCPNATLHVSKLEYDAWVNNKGLLNRDPAHIALAQKVVLPAYASRTQLFDFGAAVVPGIVAVEAVGHTPGHTAYEVGSGNRKMLVAGDLMHVAPIQLRTPEYSVILDAEPQAAITRRKILERLSDTDILFAAIHVAEIGHVRRSPSGGYTIVPAQ